MVVEQQLERARLELLDMGLRANPQLNYRSNAKSLDIIDEQEIAEDDRHMQAQTAEATIKLTNAEAQAALIMRVEAEPAYFAVCTTPYKKTDVSKLHIPKVDDFSAIPLSVLVHAVKRIVETEYPIYASLVATRLASTAGLSRVGAKIRRTVAQAIESAANRDLIRQDPDEVLWPQGRNTVKLRNWNSADANTRKLENVCDAELTNALLLTVQDAHAISVDDAASAALGLLSFQRATSTAVERMSQLAQVQCDKGVLVCENERLKISMVAVKA